MKKITRRNMFARLGSTVGGVVVGTALVATLLGAGANAQISIDPTDKAKPTPPKVGDVATNIKLPDTNGDIHDLQFYLDRGDTVVLEWFNPDCPFVKKHHAANKTMAETFEVFKDKKVTWLAINSAAPGKQGYGVERNAQAIKDYEIKYPVLMDESGQIGKAYFAKTTPHMYIITPTPVAATDTSDASTVGTLAYIGAIDSDRSARTLGEVNYVKAALGAIISGQTVEVPSSRAYGCGVKY